MYPPHVVEKLSSDLGDIADHHPSVSVLMCDIVGFTDWCSHTPPNRVIECLSAYFQILDDLAEKCGIYKVRRANDHAISPMAPSNPLEIDSCWSLRNYRSPSPNGMIVSHARPPIAAPLLPHPH